jgi:hypothetical protein
MERNATVLVHDKDLIHHDVHRIANAFKVRNRQSNEMFTPVISRVNGIVFVAQLERQAW